MNSAAVAFQNIKEAKNTLGKIDAFVDTFKLFPIWLVSWALWAHSGLVSKLSAIVTGSAWVGPGGWVPWLETHFTGTDGNFLVPFSGVLFLSLAFLQISAGLSLSLSLLRLEFLSGKSKTFFRLGLGFGLMSIAAMSFGQNWAGEDPDVLALFTYMTGSLLSLIYVEHIEKQQKA